MTPLYLEPEELLVLLQGLARSVDPLTQPPATATECSRVVWAAPDATRVQRSLATALAEATYQPIVEETRRLENLDFTPVGDRMHDAVCAALPASLGAVTYRSQLAETILGVIRDQGGIV